MKKMQNYNTNSSMDKSPEKFPHKLADNKNNSEIDAQITP